MRKGKKSESVISFFHSMDEERLAAPLLMNYLHQIDERLESNTNDSYSIRKTTNTRRKKAVQPKFNLPKLQNNFEEPQKSSRNSRNSNKSSNNPRQITTVSAKRRKLSITPTPINDSMNSQNQIKEIHEPTLPNSKPRIKRRQNSKLSTINKPLRSHSVSNQNSGLSLSAPLTVISDNHPIKELHENHSMNLEKEEKKLTIKEPEQPQQSGRHRSNRIALQANDQNKQEEKIIIKKEEVEIDLKNDQITIIERKNDVSIISNKKAIEIENKVRRARPKPKCFTFNLVVDHQPICIAIGDIEGEVKKLQPIIRLIQMNTSLDFIFVGDLFDDVSDSNQTKKQNLQCVKLLSPFFAHSNSSKMDQSTLLSSFLGIKFDYADFSSIQSRVKFIAGNAECDCLYDIQSALLNKDKPGNFEQTSDNQIVFGQGKWKKTFSFEELKLLYDYFSNCYGIIKLTKTTENQPNHFKDTVYFRHAPDTFKSSVTAIVQIPQENENVKKPLYITGHCRIFTQRKTMLNEDVFIIDTSPMNKKSLSASCNDKRLGLLSFDYRNGFCVEVFALPSVFPIV